MRIRPVSEDALMLYLGEEINEAVAARVQHCVAVIDHQLADAIIDIVPSYASVLVRFDPLQWSHLAITRRLRAALESTVESDRPAPAEIVLPVYYAPETGPELAALADRAGLSIPEVIELHSGTTYRVYAIGFAPGFAYLGEVDARLAAPRLDSPRARVPAGSVAIADRQTAVYPAASPGGWNIVGRCPVPMFEPEKTPCMPVAVGDRVRFEAIERDAFLALGGVLE